MNNSIRIFITLFVLLMYNKGCLTCPHCTHQNQTNQKQPFFLEHEIMTEQNYLPADNDIEWVYSIIEEQGHEE